MRDASPIHELQNTSAEAFAGEVVPGHRPVVMRGLVGEWPAVRAGQEGPRMIADYLKALDTDAPTTLFTAAPEMEGRFFYSEDLRGLNFSTRTIAISDLLDELLDLAGTPRSPGLYAGATPASQSASGFAAANPLPLPTPGGEPRIWIGNATRTATHFDGSHNIACVVAGRRRFTLFPPEQLRNLYVGPLDRTPAGQPVSMVDPLAPDLDRYPRFAEAWDHALVADLAPGDALFIPALWWHHVHATDDLNVLVNYWYRTGPNTTPFAAFIHAVAAIRELAPAERAAWRTWFEHYVFSPDAAHATDHIPEYARGVLSPPSPQRNQSLKQYLMNVISRF